MMKKLVVCMMMVVMMVLMGSAVAETSKTAEQVYTDVERYIVQEGLDEYRGIGIDGEGSIKTSCVFDVQAFLSMTTYDEFSFDNYAAELNDIYGGDVTVQYEAVGEMDGTVIYRVILKSTEADLAEWRIGLQTMVDMYLALY